MTGPSSFTKTQTKVPVSLLKTANGWNKCGEFAHRQLFICTVVFNEVV